MFVFLVCLMIVWEFGISSAAAQAVTLTFINASPTPVQIHWIPQEADGENKDDVLVSEELEPGDSHDVESQPGHTFRYSSLGENKWSHLVKATDEKAQSVVVGAEQDEYHVQCQSTKGPLNIVVKPRWSPRGAGRFLNLVDIGFFSGCALNRVVPNFLVQFGIGAKFDDREDWGDATILDDPPVEDIEFQKGFMSYAGSGPNSRTTEMFIVRDDTPQGQLEYFGTNPWETPFGYGRDDDGSLDVVSKWHAYGDMPPWGEGPDSGKIYPEDGYDYLKTNFPKLDYLTECHIVSDGNKADEAEEL